jgi:hypothetical protein
MTGPAASPVTDSRLRLLDALIYADTFDCAATLDEIWRYSSAPIERRALEHKLRDDPVLRRIVFERDGLYCFRDRPGLLDERPGRIDQARHLQRRARRSARLIRHLPFVRGLGLTGSAAADDATAEDDPDLLVIVAEGRLGTVFLLLGTTSRLLGRRLFCPNYYLCEARYAIPPGSVYLAREIAQVRSLAGDADVLLAANPWVVDVFPNALEPEPALERPLPAGSRVRGLLEAPLRGALGERIERWARGVAAERLQAHYGGFGEDVPPDVAEGLEAGTSLRFHGRGFDRTAVERYDARRAEIAEELSRADEAATPQAGTSS